MPVSDDEVRKVVKAYCDLAMIAYEGENAALEQRFRLYLERLEGDLIEPGKSDREFEQVMEMLRSAGDDEEEDSPSRPT